MGEDFGGLDNASEGQVCAGEKGEGHSCEEDLVTTREGLGARESDSNSV